VRGLGCDGTQVTLTMLVARLKITFELKKYNLISIGSKATRGTLP
jgi:hypothetical protein